MGIAVTPGSSRWPRAAGGRLHAARRAAAAGVGSRRLAGACSASAVMGPQPKVTEALTGPGRGGGGQKEAGLRAGARRRNGYFRKEQGR